MMKIGNHTFDVEHDCSIMGILNVTPDSFSDGGRWNNLEAARLHTADMIAQGAAIVDVGGESTRPGHVQISVQEEIDRVVPVIEMIKKNFDTPVSIDSYKSEVVEAALKAGADLVNDIWGLKYDRKVADLIAQYKVPCCLMHNRTRPSTTTSWTTSARTCGRAWPSPRRPASPTSRSSWTPAWASARTMSIT